MGAYTQSIREIMQYNKTPQQDLLNPADVHDIAMTALFDKAPLSMINTAHRDNFVTGFTLHFFNDEIGLETLPLWKIALNEKIYNNASYINLIYDNLDKQVFADYGVRRREASGTTSGEKTGTGTIGEAGTSSNTTTYNETTAYKIDEDTSSTTKVDNEVKGTGTVTDAQTGTVQNAQSGTETLAKTGTDTLGRAGTEANARTGTDTVAHTGDVTSAHTGDQTVENNNTQTTDNTGYTKDDVNSMQIAYDTPQGSLQNLRSPGGDASGTGVSYVDGQTYNYMSAAQENDQTSKHTDATKTEAVGTDNTTTTFNDTMTESRDTADETTYNSTDTKTLNTTDTRTLATNDTTTFGKTDTETRNTSNTQTRNTTDATTGTTTVTGSKEATNKDTHTGTVGDQGTKSNTTTRNIVDSEEGSHEDEENITDYRYNWEMLYKSMPLLNKVWELFDDIFMMIY